MRKPVLTGLLFSLALTPAAFAQSTSSQLPLPSPMAAPADTTNSSTTRLHDVLGNKQFEDSHEITDAKLKAEDGSLSRYSLKFNLSYYGPTLADPRAADQPNPDGSIGVYATALGGSMSGRYRIDSASTVSVGTGMKALHPFHGMDRFDVNNPYVSYDLSHRFGSLQMRNSPGLSVITVPNYLQVGEYGGVNWDNSLVYNLGTSHYALSLDTSVGYYLYNRGYKPSDRTANRYSILTAPGIKYNFSDKFSVTTSSGLTWWNPRSVGTQATLLARTVTQRVGIGYGVTRDIYFAPYLQFYPSRITADGTTLNLSTIFSIL